MRSWDNEDCRTQVLGRSAASVPESPSGTVPLTYSFVTYERIKREYSRSALRFDTHSKTDSGAGRTIGVLTYF